MQQPTLLLLLLPMTFPSLKGSFSVSIMAREMEGSVGVSSLQNKIEPQLFRHICTKVGGGAPDFPCKK